MSIKSLEEKLFHDLADIYDAEHQFLEAQQQLAEQACVASLSAMIREHIRQTEGQIENLQRVFKLLGKRPKRVKCAGAAGLIKESEKALKEAESDALRDCAIAGGLAKVEHYEMSTYRELVVLAQHLGQGEAVKLLRENLLQEEQTAQRVEQSLPNLLSQTQRAREVGR